jgi:CheY-like chemotaxis protein
MNDSALPLPESNRGDPTTSAKAQKASSPSDGPVGGNAGERRRRRRALISAPVRVRAAEITGAGPDEISTTIDVSRVGILFRSSHPGYTQGMPVRVTFPYSNAPNALHAEQDGRVARLIEVLGEQRAVAIELGGTGEGQDLVDACGRKLIDSPATDDAAHQRHSGKPLVVVVDSDPSVREWLKLYLIDEGYETIVVNNASDGLEVLNLFTPALVIAEIEGENLPGYAICSHVKATPRLRSVPVVLTTSSAYPSDYSSAHSLGAVVCMAKPYKRERLGHIVRLLAPLPQAKLPIAPPHRADPSRRAGGANVVRNGGRQGFRSGPNGSIRWWFRP